MRRAFYGSALPIAATLLLAASAAAQEEWRWEGDVPQGRTLEIKGVNGNVTAGPAPSGRVIVEATKDAKRGDPSRVTIRVIEHAGGVTICAVYPTPRGAREPNECAPGEEGRMSVRDEDTFVNFRVQVPAGVALRARTVNGRIEAASLRGDVDVATVNGDLRVATEGTAFGRTVNGSIRADVGRLGAEGMELHTVNGGIELGIPAEAGATVRASTVNGDVRSDIPLTVQGSVSGRRGGPRTIEGTIGGGGPRVELRTVNGNIQVRASG